jgi:protein O-mannosyl-transferase
MSSINEELNERQSPGRLPRKSNAKKLRRARVQETTAGASAQAGTPWYATSWAIAPLLLLLAFVAYSAAIRGPLLFDDLTLPIASPFYSDVPFSAWLKGVRPVLMLTYWLNYTPSSSSTLAYHATNIAFHALNALLVFVICRHLLRQFNVESRRVFVASTFCSLLFLLHPLQTESVAYIAGRSEVVSATFVLSAWLIYVRRIGSPVSWRESCVILLLSALAVATKEQAAATLPAIFLLTDWTFRRGSMFEELRANKRLYVPSSVGAVVGAAWIGNKLLTSPTAGLNAGTSPVEYFFSQSRAILSYLQLFFFPVGQNADREFPISHNLLEHGAALALCGLAIVIWIALRRQPPLVRYGTLLFLAFLAPTSSIVPLADPYAERRMYLPIVGLVIALSAILEHRSVRLRNFALIGAVCSSIALYATVARAEVWSNRISFWQDVVQKSPHKARGYQHLTVSYMAAGRCEDAVNQLEKSKDVMPHDYLTLINWAQAYTCVNRPDAAIGKLREAERIIPSADVYGLMGEIFIRQGKNAEAEDAFRKAAEKQPEGTDLKHVYQGNLALLANDRTRAQGEYQRALDINPFSPEALRQLRRLQAAAVDEGQSPVTDQPAERGRSSTP